MKVCFFHNCLFTFEKVLEAMSKIRSILYFRISLKRFIYSLVSRTKGQFQNAQNAKRKETSSVFWLVKGTFYCHVLSLLFLSSLERLSNLEGVNLELYRTLVLPKTLDVIVKSNDKMAQQYLMECIIQVFPDEYHMSTLDTFLSSCLDLHTDVDLRAIFTSLMDRLSSFTQVNFFIINAHIYIFKIEKSIRRCRSCYC